MKPRPIPLDFAATLVSHGIPWPVTEHKFHPTRKWRFDYAWPSQMVALEVEGGTWSPKGSRHNRGSGFVADIEKYNAATVHGWRIIRCVPRELCRAATMANLRDVMSVKKAG